MSDENQLAKQPIYNIRSVAERTKISPETLRAWERRYGFPVPHRNPKGYRLYSEDEIAGLNWLRNQTDAGMTIGQAIKLLMRLKESGQDPTQISPRLGIGLETEFQPADRIRASLLDALLALDESESVALFNIALTHHPLDQALMEIIAPIMTEIGDLWHSGQIPIAVEHFATQICRSQLIQVLDVDTTQPPKGQIITACAPGEWHEIGILMLTSLLRWRGWGVTYLGANLSLERFSEVLQRLQPHLVLFSATFPETAENLIDMIQILAELPDPKPLIGLGGQAFLIDPTLANRIPGSFFGPRADDGVDQIEGLLTHVLAKA